jgi:esterase/lipase
MSKIIIENKLVQGIPLNEFYLENHKYKGLVFVQHGYRSNKERGGDYLAVKIARDGYFVVCIDSFMHGARSEGPFIEGSEKERLYYIPSIIRKTALDIIKLHKTYYKEYQTFDLIGVSLGGMIAYYTSIRTDKINKLIPVISTPKVTKQAEWILKQNGINLVDYFTEETYNYLQSCDPINEADSIQYKEMFILNGTLDKVVSTQDSVDYYEEYKNNHMRLTLYEVDHNVNAKMQQDIILFLNE